MSAAVFFPVPASLYWGTTLTSLRAIGNGVTPPLMEGVSIGAGTEPSSLFGGEDDPYYNYAYYPARITSEIILTLSPFALGNASRVGRVLQAIDFTLGAVGLVQQGHDIHQNDLNGWNGTLFVLNLFGTGFNGKGVVNLSRVGKPLDGVADSAGALGNRAEVVEDVAGVIAPNSNGRGLIGLVKPGGTVDDALRIHYVDIARSPQMARAVERYNKIARFLGQKPSASIDEIVKALGGDVTFSRVGHLRSGIFAPGQHPAATKFWIQGNPATAYGRRVGRHELTHLGAALRGQGDTFLHEIAVQAATTPENLVFATGVIVVIGGEVYWVASQ
ncbi:MAG: hypothetical protein U0939_09470 [Pirellulales bacterium]